MVPHQSSSSNENTAADRQLAFRAAMARVGASVNIITSNGPAGKGGFTATAMCSVTDDPPTLLVCMNRRSAQCDLFLQNGVLCVNVLDHAHTDLAGFFAGKITEMQERYNAAEWDSLPSGNLALRDAVVSLDCRISTHHTIGTHHVIFAEVETIRIRAEGNPLLYLDRGYVQAKALNKPG